MMPSDTPLGERKFSDREVREILKKAVEKAPSRALAKGEGISLSDLKSIGEEVGIDPDRVEDAARAVALGGGKKPFSLLGFPRILNFSRKVKGELDPADIPEVLALIRRIMGQQGEADEIHGLLEWSTKGEIGESYVTLSSRDETTTITSSANLTQMAVVGYLPAGLIGTILSIVGFTTSANAGNVPVMLLSLLAVPALLTIIRALLKKVSASESAKLQKVVDDLARLTKQSGD
jgi:hypothetical protein